MNCQRIIPMLSAYQDGEIDPALGPEVELHLRECPSCRAEWDGLQELIRRLRRGLPPADDLFFPARVMAALRSRPARRTSLLQAAAYALASAMVFLAGFWLQTSAGGQASAEPRPAATFSSVLLEPQDLGLLAVHDDTLSMFNGGDHGQK